MAGDPVVIPQGVDLARFTPGDRATARQALGLPRAGPLVLFSAFRGTANAYRDPAMLWGALRHLASRRSDLRALLLGDEGAALPADVEPLVLRVPHVDDEPRLVRHYQAADVLLHPARADTAPLGVVEAMACGLPVVASRVGGIPELISDDETGLLVNPGDGAGAARSIERILDDAQLAARLSRSARDRARRNHDARDHLAATIEVYRGAMATHARSATASTAPA
jgi:glycosyltransferase involved in cell wall biosynthesis